MSGYTYTRLVNVPDKPSGSGHVEKPSAVKPGGKEDAYVVDKLDEFMKDWKGKWAGNKQCVNLVQKAVPDIGLTTSWSPGDKISGPGKPPLAVGTAVAVFGSDGKYKNKKGESHAGIFLGYGKERGKDGIYLFDQYAGKDGSARKRFYAFKSGNNSGNYPAETYSVIKKK